MSDFELFEQAIAIYETKKSPILDNCEENICQHFETITENGVISCQECGEEIHHKIMHEKEWTYYSSSSGKKFSDPNRTQARKTDERSIHKDVENMGFSDSIVDIADEFYNKAAKGQIYRGDSRKALIFASIFEAFKLTNNYQLPEILLRQFNLPRKKGLRGLKIVAVNLPKDTKVVNTKVVTPPVHLIYDIMDKFRATQAQKNEVVKLYELVKNRSSKLNRARPQSVASALVFYWICKKKIDISQKEFAKKVELSEITIDKNAIEVALILGTPDILR